VKSFGQTTVDDSYVHEESKAQRGDKFVGLMCDQANQDDLTEERVEKWVGQLVEEGFFSGEGSSPPPVAAAAAAAVEVEVSETPIVQVVKDSSKAPSSSVSYESTWKGYRNDEKGSTLWVNKDNQKER
jgi:flavodoxin I